MRQSHDQLGLECLTFKGGEALNLAGFLIYLFSSIGIFTEVH